MSTFSNFDSTVKEEMSDVSFVQNEEILPVKRDHAVKKEPVGTLVPIKAEVKNNGNKVINTGHKTELYDKVKEDYVVHKFVKEEPSFPYYTHNLQENQQEPLAIIDDIEDMKKEHLYMEDTKKECATVVQGKWLYEDIKYQIDKEEPNLGSYVDNDRSVARLRTVLIMKS